MNGATASGCRVPERGRTLVETLAVIAIWLILLRVAIPSIMDWMQQTRLAGAAEVTKVDLLHAVSESIKRGQNISLTFQATPSGEQWCYGFSVATACDCTVSDSCTLDGKERTASSNNYTGIRLEPHVADNRFSIQPRHATVTAGNILLTAENGKQLKIVISGYGRIRACSPAGTSNVSGYAVC